jgi:hypothetical protein
MLVHLATATKKRDELEEMYSTKKSTGSKKRTFGEITSDADFEERCLSHKKGCAIGLLPAVTVIDYEQENFDQHVQTLASLDHKAKTMPVYYAWINVTCHPEWLKYFEIDQFQIPTVVFYYPEKELQANLIGKFDEETVSDHEDRFLKGKLPTWAPKTPFKKMVMTSSSECQSQDFEAEKSQEDLELEEEILREILEEEAAREKEANTRKNINKSQEKKGTKKKGKKKGKKGGAKKDEL